MKLYELINNDTAIPSKNFRRLNTITKDGLCVMREDAYQNREEFSFYVGITQFNKTHAKKLSVSREEFLSRQTDSIEMTRYTGDAIILEDGSSFQPAYVSVNPKLGFKYTYFFY